MNGISEKEFLSFFDKNAICITWPNEIKYIADKYGFELISVDSLSKLDPQKDIAIVLIHGAYFTKQYHWLVFPINNVNSYYGNKTVIDKIYLMKLKVRS